ncbi:SAM-dependent methyltransferase [Micromonospora tulbaghiae]|uniref:SAM-dependent methyltransferase n=1 Tax=Micromonospora tulbaghiae TaxID=479978 RepID=A0A386WX08_9ACTN|nr:methyltransferase domain-containing protein [Micromonospora tulbaghiae]AYF31960.1 SAM-dependent methyltransferase [Micromonospora tulbaghiae]
MTTQDDPGTPVAQGRQVAAQSDEGKVRSYYEFRGRKNTGWALYRSFLDAKKLYVNYGYWKAGCTNLDEASEALADMLAEVAGIKPGDRVLDAGFGYGEQDVRWARTFGPLRIHGLNITPAQVDAARARIAEEGLADMVDLRVGSATEVPFGDATVDRVVALESAMHFHTRQRFFEEAVRVLVPGGTLATADILPSRVEAPGKGPVARLNRWVRERTMPSENWYTMSEYAARLERAGFVDVDVRPITEHVIAPRLDFIRARFDAPENRGRSWFERMQMRLLLWAAEKQRGTREYILAVARKPAT